MISHLLARKRKGKPFLSISRKVPPLNLGYFQQELVNYIVNLESGLEILDARLPVQEGSALVDLVASNPEGDLILIWTPQSLTLDFLLKILAQSDWIQKNHSLWEHLFPSVQKGEGLKFKLWVFAQEVTGDIQSMLQYLKAAPRIFEYDFIKKGEETTLQVRSLMSVKPEKTASVVHHLPRSPKKAPTPAPKKNSNMAIVPPLTQEEIRDLTSGFGNFEVNWEDEITDPFIHLSELKA